MLPSPIPDLGPRLSAGDQQTTPPVCTAEMPSFCRMRVDKRRLRGLRGCYHRVRSPAVSYKHIRYEKSDRIARVILNRPRYKNAQSRLMIEEMDAAFAAANEDDDIRVVILKGEGEHFSSGHDLGTPEDKEDTVNRPYPKGMRGQHKRSWDLYIDAT